MLQEWADYLDGLSAKARQVPALSFSWETRRSRHPAWTGISVCPGCVKGSETSSPATTPSGYSTSPLQSLSVMSAESSGRSIKRNEGDRRRKKTPEKGGRKNGKKLERQQRERRKTATARLARHGLFLLNIAQHFLTTQEQEEKRRCGTVSLNQKNRNDFRVSSTGLVSVPRILRISGVSANGLPRREGQTTGIPQSRLASPYTTYWEMVKKRFPEGCVIENG